MKCRVYCHQHPKHEEIGLGADKWVRTLTALQRHRQLNNNAITNIRDTIQASIEYVHTLGDKDREQAFEEWIDRILDASQGYRRAHAVTRGNPKAPPLPTQIWVKDQYVGHPHEIAQIYLQEWGAFWGQPEYEDHQVLWDTMRKIIKQTRKLDLAWADHRRNGD